MKIVLKIGLLAWMAAMLLTYLLLTEPWVYNHRRTRPMHAEIEGWFTAKTANQSQ